MVERVPTLIPLSVDLVFNNRLLYFTQGGMHWFEDDSLCCWEIKAVLSPSRGT
jgi:hypothetical protein